MLKKEEADRIDASKLKFELESNYVLKWLKQLISNWFCLLFLEIKNLYIWK